MNYYQFEGRLIRLSALIRYAKIYNNPTEGKIPELIWRLFSSEIFTIKFSTKMYLEMGYNPFSGYPLEINRREQYNV